MIISRKNIYIYIITTRMTNRHRMRKLSNRGEKNHDTNKSNRIE